MSHRLKTNDLAIILAAIREDNNRAYNAFLYDSDRDDAEWHLQAAYTRMRVLLEALGLPEALRALQQSEANAATSWLETRTEPSGEPYLVWGARLFQFERALETTLAEPKPTTVAKDVIEILRATQYSITDKNCFDNPPADEKDVHVRIEAVLRCVFPDLLHKPPIAKQIKNFEPDTGLPSIQTLIEYKFMADSGAEKKIADEILADTRGYISEDWKTFIYVIYETKRIKPESQWRQLLRTSGVDANTEVIVISGEPPRRPARAARAQGARSSEQPASKPADSG